MLHIPKRLLEKLPFWVLGEVGVDEGLWVGAEVEVIILIDHVLRHVAVIGLQIPTGARNTRS